MDREVLLQRKIRVEVRGSKGLVSACGANLVKPRSAESGKWRVHERSGAAGGAGGALCRGIDLLNQGCRRPMVGEAEVSLGVITTDGHLQGFGGAVGIARRRTWNGVTASLVAQRIGKTARPVEHWADLPSADDLVHPARCAGIKLLIASERQLVNAVNDELFIAGT